MMPALGQGVDIRLIVSHGETLFANGLEEAKKRILFRFPSREVNQVFTYV